MNLQQSLQHHLAVNITDVTFSGTVNMHSPSHSPELADGVGCLTTSGPPVQVDWSL